MLFSKEYVGYLAREITKKLVAGELIETKEQPAVTERVHATLLEELSLEDRIADRPGDFRVLTGDRPTGPLHLGHYFGTLHNRVRLQNRGVDLFVVVADYQVLTDRDVAERLDERVLGLLCDYLAVGIDPERSTIDFQSTACQLCV